MTVDWESWGLRLQAVRRERGWSQGELAAKLGVARNTVNRWEMGERHPSMRMLERLAAVLKVSGHILLPAKRLRGPDPDATVPAHRFRFDAAQLFRVDDAFALPLARLMMATDDIRHLRKLLIVHHSPLDPTTAEKAVAEGEIMHLFRLLCGHLFEGISSFADLDKSPGLLDASVRAQQSEQDRWTAALKSVRRERAILLSKNGRRHFLAVARNLVAFHYPDDQKLKRTLAKHLWHDRSPDRLVGTLVLSPAQGIGRFSVTDNLMTLMLRDEVGGTAEDFPRAYKQAIGQSIDLAQSLIDVVDCLIAHIVAVNRLRSEVVTEVIRIHPGIVEERKRLEREGRWPVER